MSRRNPEYYCTANVKTCPIEQGGCGYKYKKGDTKWQDGGVCPQCGRDRRCTRYRVRGATVCQIHGIGSKNKGRVGGSAGRNPDIRLAMMPKEVGKLYVQAQTDPDLRRFDKSLATQEAMVADSLKRMQSGESGEAWKELGQELPAFFDTLRSCVQTYRNAAYTVKQTGFTPELKQAMESALDNLMNTATGPTPDYLLSIVKRGRYAWAAREELRVWEEQLRKTRESDMRQLKDLKAMVAVDQFIRFTEAVAIAIEKHIDNPDLRRAIGFDVQSLLQLPEGLTVEMPLQKAQNIPLN